MHDPFPCTLLKNVRSLQFAAILKSLAAGLLLAATEAASEIAAPEDLVRDWRRFGRTEISQLLVGSTILEPEGGLWDDEDEDDAPGMDLSD